MSTVAEIEQAIRRLSPTEASELERWWDEFREARWDGEIGRDAAPEGKLAKLLQQVHKDIDSGRTTEFPR